jgi:pre-mRNA-processing factor 8
MPDPIDVNQDALDQKSRKWQSINNKRFSEKRKAGYVQQAKSNMPPEHLRRIIKDHGDLSRYAAASSNLKVLHSNR